MKKLLLILISIISFSCKKEIKIAENKVSTAEKIAQAHGLTNWNTINQIDFTFNVDKDSSHFERSWSWKPKQNEVSLIVDKDTISYNRSKIDSLTIQTDQGFINDKYWLLAPFQLVWDQGTKILDSTNKIAPISKIALNKLTLVYSNSGGYTPGDAYDFYYNDNYMIKEWIFRKGNTATPSMITSFENYEDFKGIKIAKDHKKPEGTWNLYFTNISIKTD
ncbi:hypothetical protein [Olleya sp. HaHaR_3_96]|uniref:hypothetical protein n=1 Tax=Olleya sp. HaHaR_3_96 TaxID=2745560 RepID=UPI001C4F49B2|nr:hypothetical protein [Olleya sp. HaHaR_3_96]QXP61367.1 hypothetical protein H0I26_06955 [Olleya sp. HaHaR_3_96]